MRVRTGTGLPSFMKPTASSKAKQLPTMKWEKAESRFPPRMVLRKPVVPLAVAPDEKEATPAVSKEEAAVVSPESLPEASLAPAHEAVSTEASMPTVEKKTEEAPEMEFNEGVPLKAQTPEESSLVTPKESISTTPDHGASLPLKVEEKKSLLLCSSLMN